MARSRFQSGRGPRKTYVLTSVPTSGVTLLTTPINITNVPLGEPPMSLDADENKKAAGTLVAWRLTIDRFTKTTASVFRIWAVKTNDSDASADIRDPITHIGQRYLFVENYHMNDAETSSKSVTGQFMLDYKSSTMSKLSETESIAIMGECFAGSCVLQGIKLQMWYKLESES